MATAADELYCTIRLECEARGLCDEAARRIVGIALAGLRREEVAAEAQRRLLRDQLKVC